MCFSVNNHVRLIHFLCLAVGLVALCNETRLQRLLQWPLFPPSATQEAAGKLVRALVSIFNIPFTQQASEILKARVSKIIYNHLVVTTLIVAVGHIRVEDAAHPMGFLCRLVLSSPYFIKQFLSYGGLQCISKCNLLAPHLPTELTVDVLQIISQLARSSEASYESIRNAGLLIHLRPLLEHKDGRVRAKVCNSLGNFCRHSSFFYSDLKSAGLLSGLMACCRDANLTARKFAAFAVGNAAFYDDSLCGALAPSIPSLVILLRDEPKTASNAAAAIGNLVRNSDVVVVPILRAGAIEALLELVTVSK